MPFTPKTWADGSGGGTPITAAELNRLEKGVADATAGLALKPAVGKYATISGVTGYGFNQQASGIVYFHPFWISAGFTADAFRTRIADARSGGVAIRKFGLYADAGGYPDTSGAVAVANVNDANASGGNGSDYPFSGGPVALNPGLYWCASIYYASTAPSAAANVLCITGATYALPTDDFNAPDAVPRALTLSGRSDLPAATVLHADFGIFKGNDCPALLIRRSA